MAAAAGGLLQRLIYSVSARERRCTIEGGRAVLLLRQRQLQLVVKIDDSL